MAATSTREEAATEQAAQRQAMPSNYGLVALVFNTESGRDDEISDVTINFFFF